MDSTRDDVQTPSKRHKGYNGFPTAPDGHEQQQQPLPSSSLSPGPVHHQYPPQQSYASPQQPYASPQQPYASPQQPYVSSQQQYASPQQPYATAAAPSNAAVPPSGSNGFGSSHLSTTMAPSGAPSVALELTPHGGIQPPSAASTPVRAHYETPQSTPLRTHQPHPPSPGAAAGHSSALTVVHTPSPSPAGAHGASPLTVVQSPSQAVGAAGGVTASPGGVVASPGVAGPLHDPPCAACKSLRRKCTRECIFLPYFPRDDPEKFARVHKVFGASNVSKMLQELPLHQREDAVASLEYEAQARVQDPVYGCVGILCVLQRQVVALREQLAAAQGQSQIQGNGGPDANGQAELQPSLIANPGTEGGS